jgi:hypothetical protein
MCYLMQSNKKHETSITLLYKLQMDHKLYDQLHSHPFTMQAENICSNKHSTNSIMFT